MKKPFLLMAGSYYYPGAGADDWIRHYETYEEALSQVEVITHCEYYKKGKNKGLLKSSYETYKIQDIPHDWYKILDLRDGTE